MVIFNMTDKHYLQNALLVWMESDRILMISWKVIVKNDVKRMNMSFLDIDSALYQTVKFI